MTTPTDTQDQDSNLHESVYFKTETQDDISLCVNGNYITCDNDDCTVMDENSRTALRNGWEVISESEMVCPLCKLNRKESTND